MPAAGGVAVRQLIDQDQRRPSRQRRIEIEFPQRPIPIGHLFQRQLFEALQQGGGFLAAVGFDQAHHHIHALLAQLAGGQQHGVGFADARRRAEKDLQLAALGMCLFLLEAVEQLVGIGAGIAGLPFTAWVFRRGWPPNSEQDLGPVPPGQSLVGQGFQKIRQHLGIGDRVVDQQVSWE
jgi:hypothetical protein